MIGLASLPTNPSRDIAANIPIGISAVCEGCTVVHLSPSSPQSLGRPFTDHSAINFLEEWVANSIQRTVKHVASIKLPKSFDLNRAMILKNE